MVGTDAVTVHLLLPLLRSYSQDPYSRAQVTAQITDWLIVTDGMYVEGYRPMMEKCNEVVQSELVRVCFVDVDGVAVLMLMEEREALFEELGVTERKPC